VKALFCAPHQADSSERAADWPTTLAEIAAKIARKGLSFAGLQVLQIQEIRKAA